MARPDMRIHTPWWAKIAAKVVLARLPVAREVWRRVGVFRPGYMATPEYAYRVFQEHLARVAPWRPREGFVCLEFGPGDSLFTALVAKALGAARTILLDAERLAVEDMAAYREMGNFLERAGLTPPDISAAETLDELLAACDSAYPTGGVRSLAQLPDASVDFVFSQAVLEHVRRAEIRELMGQTHRVLRPGGVCSHVIDLKDHLGGGLDSLRFPSWVWEAHSFAARSGFYTNRLRYSKLLAIFEECGFRAHVASVRRWSILPTPRRALAAPFRDLPDEELTLSGFDVVLQRR